MPTYLVRFKDGSSVRVDADNVENAKAKGKTVRRNSYPILRPGKGKVTDVVNVEGAGGRGSDL